MILEDSFACYPTTGQLRNLLNVKIYNLMGQEVLTGEISQDQPLDMSSLGRGVYLVRWAGGSSQNYACVVRE